MNILIGPKLGDFLHCLLIPKMIWELTKQKSNIFICEAYKFPETFTTGIKKTYEELLPLMIEQEFVNKFEIFNDQNIDMYLSDYRLSNKLYNDSWTNIILNSFMPDKDPIKNLKILNLKKDKKFEDKILISRKAHRCIADRNVFYSKFIHKFKENVFYIRTKDEMSENQFAKNHVENIVCENFYEFATAINSCKLFIGNLSSPLALATCLNKDRICELVQPDAIHYINDVKNYDNMSFFDHRNHYICERHNDFIKDILEV